MIWPQKATTLVRDYEFFIPTKFHQYPSSSSGEEVENVNSLTYGGQMTRDHNRSLETLAPMP